MLLAFRGCMVEGALLLPGKATSTTHVMPKLSETCLKWHTAAFCGSTWWCVVADIKKGINNIVLRNTVLTPLLF